MHYANNKLIETGVSDIIINIHHFGEQIIDFVILILLFSFLKEYVKIT